MYERARRGRLRSSLRSMCPSRLGTHAQSGRALRSRVVGSRCGVVRLSPQASSEERGSEREASVARCAWASSKGVGEADAQSCAGLAGRPSSGCRGPPSGKRRVLEGAKPKPSRSGRRSWDRARRRGARLPGRGLGVHGARRDRRERDREPAQDPRDRRPVAQVGAQIDGVGHGADDLAEEDAIDAVVRVEAEVVTRVVVGGPPAGRPGPLLGRAGRESACFTPNPGAASPLAMPASSPHRSASGSPISLSSAGPNWCRGRPGRGAARRGEDGCST
jgi:hypothetical protein